MDLQAYRETSLQTWDEMASGWEDRREWLLRHHRGDQRVAGRAGRPAAGPDDPRRRRRHRRPRVRRRARVGEDGGLICTDFAPEMIEAARRNGERLGLSNVEYRVLDAERMDLADDSVDGVLSRWSFMLMADPAAALAETRRVLRDGGTLAFAVWQTPDRNPWAALPGMTLVQRGHMPPPEPGAPGIFAMGEAERVRELVAGAGFGEQQIEELTFEWRYAAEDLWDTLTRLAGPLARVINGLDDEERDATRAAIEQSLDQYRDGDELVVPAACWGVTAR